MLKKMITYTDYNGQERTEPFYFNLTKTELMKMENENEVAFSEDLKRTAENMTPRDVIRIIDYLVSRSYGIKTDDGKRFLKSPEISKEFMETPAYDALFDEFLSDANGEAFNKFVMSIVPQV